MHTVTFSVRRAGHLAALCSMVLLAVGCASSSGGVAAPGGGVATNPNVISTAELTAINVSNAHDAISRLRPNWLTLRGQRSVSQRIPTEIIVAINGAYFGNTDSLRQFSMNDIQEFRRLDSAQAGAMISGLGSRHVDSAIVIVLRGR